MRGDEVGHHVLLEAELGVHALERLAKLLVDVLAGLSHEGEHVVGDVLGRHAQLARHVVGAQLADELLAVRVGHDVVEADARAHEDLLHAGKLAQLAQQVDVGGVVGAQVAARFGEEALLGGAHASLELLGAGRCLEVRRGAAHVVDVALEVGQLRERPGLAHERLVAARLQAPPLVEGQRAEAAAAEAAAVGGERELDLLDGGDAAGRLVVGVVSARVGQLVHEVQLVGAQGFGGRVLHYEEVLLVLLHQRLGIVGVHVAVLLVEAPGVGRLVVEHLLVGGQYDGVYAGAQVAGAPHRAGHVGDVLHGDACGQRVGYLVHRPLAHAVDEQVGVGVEQHRALERVAPVVVVGKPAQACLDAADDDGGVLEALADEVAVHAHRAVGAKACLAAGGVGVARAALLVGRVVVHHRVHVARRHEEAQARLAEHRDALGVAPVGLGDDAHRVAEGREHPRDDGRAEGRVVHVGVARHIHEVELVDAAVLEVLRGGGQECRAVGQGRGSGLGLLGGVGALAGARGPVGLRMLAGAGVACLVGGMARVLLDRLGGLGAGVLPGLPAVVVCAAVPAVASCGRPAAQGPAVVMRPRLGLGPCVVGGTAARAAPVLPALGPAVLSLRGPVGHGSTFPSAPQGLPFDSPSVYQPKRRGPRGVLALQSPSQKSRRGAC